MKGFILSSEEETIAVIGMTSKDEFYVKVRTAIAEHYCCEKTDDVSINMSHEQYEKELYSQEIEVDSIEQEEESTRKYFLTETVIY